MSDKIRSILSALFFLVVAIALLHGCANIASPTGGPYDVDPPKVKRAFPEFNALNSHPKRIEIEFDENIKIKSPSEKVIVTPPQKEMPVIRSIGRKAVIELNDELIDNTTYTIDFTDAIGDNNEENLLENFVYSFSTGEQIDSFAVSGRVLEAATLEPVKGMVVGIHTNLDDTAFTRTPFDRHSKTDSRGNFAIRGMAPGAYKLFALNDANRDYKYDNPQEAIAFLDSIIIPSSMPAVRQDTLFKDSTTIDTILTVHYTRFLPDDLVLRSFTSDFQRRYLQKHERPERQKLRLFFAAPTQMATFSLLHPQASDNSWYALERSAENDTLMLWITDSLVYRQDTIRMRIDYLRTDSLHRDYIDTDTLSFNFKEPRRRPNDAEKEKKKKKSEGKDEKEGEEMEEIVFLPLKSNVQASFELFNPIRLEFEQPVVAFDSSFVQLAIKKDSLFHSVDFRFETDSLNPRKFVLRPVWIPGESYKLTIDSATVFSCYGLWNNKFDQTFTVKSLKDYGNLEITLSGLPEGKSVFVELLDKSDKPFRKSKIKSNKAKFQDLPPGDMYARLVIDDNGDGKWTTGNYEKNRLPETVCYYPGKFVIRAYTDHSEEWDLLATPLIRQKPLEITKNKPEERKRRNLNEEREKEKKQNRQGSFSPGMGSGGRQTGGGGQMGADLRGDRSDRRG